MSPEHYGSTNYREDTAALKELEWRASVREGYNLSQLLGDADVSPLKVEFGENVKSGSVTPYSISVIKALMLLSGIETLKVTSAYRSPEQQARVMQRNLEHGKRIKYAAPGKAVTDAYDRAKKAGYGQAKTRRLMTNEIYRVGPENVSKHESMPGWMNVVDIAPSSVDSKKRQKFVSSATAWLVRTFFDSFIPETRRIPHITSRYRKEKHWSFKKKEKSI